MGDSTEYVYGGSSSSLDPNYGKLFVGYRMPFSDIGTSMDARTANQVKETSKHLNTGLKVFEVAAHSPEVFEAMPKDQLQEINRLAKLTGSEATMHAPMIDPTGITQHGWDKLTQKEAERQLWSAIERSHDLNPKGNVVVTMHASTSPLPAPDMKFMEEVKNEETGEKERKAITKSMILIDPKGRLHQIKEEPRFFPTETSKVGEQVPFDATKEIERENRELWQKQLTNVGFYAQTGEEIIEKAIQQGKEFEHLTEKDWEQVKKEFPEIPNTERDLAYGAIRLKDAYMNLKEMYDLAYKNSDKKERAKLDVYANEIKPHIATFDKATQTAGELKKFAEMIEKGVKTIGQIEQPKILTPLRDFAVEKSAETVANIAAQSYKKFKDSSPIISLENHPAYQSLLTTGEDLKEVITKAREQFEELAVKDGASKSEAQDAAKKIIGATWDVGHINMLRKYGYNDKEIVKQTEIVAPFVKHVHLSDNFGFEHSELPMGMGNVPIKEIMGKLGKEGFKGKKVVEALSWWQHFSEQGVNHAIVPTMQAFGSPIYGMQNAPYWNQAAGTMGSYFGFPAAYLPEKHFATYGTGFSMLPEELGGTIPGTNSRFTGTPNA